MPPGRSNLHGPFHVLLTSDIAEISIGVFRLKKGAAVEPARGNGDEPAQGFHELIEGLDRVHVNPFNHSRFRRVLRGKENPSHACFLCCDSHGKGPFDGPDESVQGKLPQDQMV